MSQKKTALTAVLALMMAVMLSLMGGGIRAFASAEYIPSWEEYKAAGNPASTWNDVADSIDKLMEASYQLYVEGKLKTRSWEKDGQIRRKTEVIAENVQILYRPEQYRNQNAAVNNQPAEDQNDEAQVQEPETQEKRGFFNDIF